MAKLSFEDGGKALSTKNVKGNRLVVFAEYYAPDSIFKIPDGLDLEDKNVVETWWVRRNMLHIQYVGEEDVVSIDPLYDFHYDLKYPNECEIRPVDDYYNDAYKEEDAEEDGDGVVNEIACLTLIPSGATGYVRKEIACVATILAGATGYVKKEQSERVKEILATLDDLLKEDFDEYKSVWGHMGAKILHLKKQSEPDNKPRCVCGVWLRLKKHRDGGKCEKCVQAIKRMTAVAGGE
jgi:hypothetical protein